MARHDMLAHWHDRRQINQRQFDAGRRFERLYERAHLGGHHTAIDLERPRVDRTGSTGRDVDVVLAARDEMLALRQVLGAFDFALVSRILGAGRDLAEEPNSSERRYLAHRIRDALGMMAVRFAIELPERQ